MTVVDLRLDNLTVTFPAGRNRHEVVSDLSLEVAAGTTLGIVGESGSGKSVTLRAIMGLLPGSARITSGALRMGDAEIPLIGKGLRAARRRRLSMVFQDPLAALDPLMRVGDQIAEVPRRVFGESKSRSRELTLDLMRRVQIPDPERRATAYPHELSGGQRQRVVIAMALACRPEMMLCDEPTTALDVTVQAQVLELLDDLRRREGLSMIFVSHDLAVVSAMAAQVMVMRAGIVVETGPTPGLLNQPREAYTRSLLDAVLELPEIDEPAPAASVKVTEAATADGSVIADLPEYANPVDPGSVGRAPASGVPQTFDARPVDVPPTRPEVPARLVANNIVVTYGGGTAAVRAVDGVDFLVAAGRIHGLVGESGSGKTTLAKVMIGQLKPDSGQVFLGDTELPERRTRNQLSAIQLIYQDPYSSLDPRMTVRQTLSELLRLVKHLPRPQIEPRCAELLDQVGLPTSSLDGYPGQFSGGQRQRIAIARALAVEPSVLVADEPTSALDVSIQAAVLDLLVGLRDDLGLAIVVISHNLAVVRHICDEVSVMLGGRIVESGPAARVLDHPAEQYTQDLIRAVPRVHRRPPAEPAGTANGGPPHLRKENV